MSELCQMNSGGTPSRSVSTYYGGSIPWAKISDIEAASAGYVCSTEEHITEAGLKAIGGRYFQEGTLLLAMYGSVGKLAFAGTSLSTNQAILGIRVKDTNVLDSNYLFYWLQSIKPRLTERAVGGTLQNISLGIVKGLDVPLPHIHVQQQIANTLSKADALRRKDQELLLKYDELAQGIFYEMFGDPEHNTKGWNVQLFGQLIRAIKSGTSLGGEDRELQPGEFGVLKVSAVTTGIFKPQEYKVPAQGEIVKEKVTVSKGDLLFSRANTRELVGAVAIAENTYPNLMLPDKLWRIDLHLEQMRKHYCKAILTDKGIRYNLTKTATGTSGSMLNISMAKLRDLELPVPPIELQTEFEVVSKKILVQKRLAEKSAAQSEQLFTSLLNSYFA